MSSFWAPCAGVACPPTKTRTAEGDSAALDEGLTVGSGLHLLVPSYLLYVAVICAAQQGRRVQPLHALNMVSAPEP